MPSSGITGLYGISIFNFLRNLHPVFHTSTVPSTVHKCSFSSTSLPSFVVSCLFDFSHSDKCEVISHCGFDFISLIMSDVEHLFMCLLAICFFNVCLFLKESESRERGTHRIQSRL